MGNDQSGNNLLGYAILRGGTSIGRDQHFLTGVRGPIQFLLRVLQMFCSAVMIGGPLVYYFTSWKASVLLWLAGGAFIMLGVLYQCEKKLVAMVYGKNANVPIGLC